MSATTISKDILLLDPAIESQRIAERLRELVLQVLKRRGVVVGLSGGVDSSVAAAVAVRAVGRERVLGLLMPEAECSPDSLRLGQLVADALGIETIREDVTGILDAAGCYDRRNAAIRSVFPALTSESKVKIVLPGLLDEDRYRISHLIVEEPTGRRSRVRLTADSDRAIVAATNFKQRARKMMEYYHADRLQYAVVGTPNRLEYDQGFFVKNGDGAADVKPIAHLFKSQVYQLAGHLEIPEEIRNRPPSTDTVLARTVPGRVFLFGTWTTSWICASTRSTAACPRRTSATRLDSWPIRSSASTTTSRPSAADSAVPAFPRLTCRAGSRRRVCLMTLLERAAEVGLWVGLLTVFYVYVGYPLTLLIWPARRTVSSARGLPAVTVVIAAFNEATHIAATVKNKLAQNYPADLLDVVVVSDGSTDGTDEIVTALREPRVHLVTAGAAARQDARPQSRAGVRGLRDYRLLGRQFGVSGRCDPAPRLGVPGSARRLCDWPAGLRGPWPDRGRRGFRALHAGRELASEARDASGFGGRRQWWRRCGKTRLDRPMRADQLPDFILPLGVVEQGYRTIHVEEAIAREQALGKQADEFKMRVRVTLRALHGLADMRTLLQPRFGLFAFQLLVHKAIRYLVIVPCAAVFLLNLFLLQSPFYRALLVAQTMCYLLAAIGLLSRGRIRWRPVFVPFYFCLINLAAAAALVSFLRGQRQVLWTPRKGA